MNELSKNLFCVQIRSGVELWFENDRAKKIQTILENIITHKFINIDEESINTADIVGVFSAKTMEDLTRRKNGEWKCKKGKWHEKGGQCSCARDFYRGQELKIEEIPINPEGLVMIKKIKNEIISKGKK